MTAATPKIVNALAQLSATLGTIGVVSDPVNVSCPLNVSAISFMNTYQGTFTPADNSLTIFSPSGASQSPNLICLLVDQPIGLTIVSNAVNIVAAVPVNKLYYATFATLTSPITAIKLDGVIVNALSTGVQQGVLLNYFLIAATCTVS